MARPRTGAFGLTAVEVAVASLVVFASFGLGTWVLSERQRRDLTHLAVFSPGQVFLMNCEYVDTPTRFRSVVCTVKNPNRYDLPLTYRANSFFERRLATDYAGLPITEYPVHETNEDGTVSSMVPRGGSIDFVLFSDFPLEKQIETVIMNPATSLARPGLTVLPGQFSSGSVALSGYSSSHSPGNVGELRKQARVAIDDRAIIYSFSDAEKN